MKRTITALFLLTAAISCAQKPTTLEGSWYGLYTGSPASVTFNPDGTYQMWSEAFSQMNMAGTYTQEGNTLSLGGIPGMDGKGLFAIDGQEIKPVDGGVGIGSISVDLKPLTEEEIQQFRDLTDEVSRVWETDQSLFEIIDEETKPFFAGDKSADETAKTIQNRATTYLNESK